MIEERDIAVLAELGRIVARHGSSSVSRLAELIRDPQQAEALATAMEFAAARPRREKTKPGSRKTYKEKADRVGISVLKDLEVSNPDKHSIVAEIREYLVQRALLQSMAEFRRFARQHTLSIGETSSRTAAITPFLRSLSELSTPEILAIRDSMMEFQVEDRSLERWRDVIVRPRVSQNVQDRPC